MKKQIKLITNKRIENYVESFFEGIEYSKEVDQVKEKIIAKISREYEKELEENKTYAFKTIVNKYNSLETMVESIDYDSANIDRWYSKEVSSSYDEFYGLLKKEINHSYLVSIITVFFIISVIGLLLHLNSYLIYLIFSIVFLALDVFVIIKYKVKSPKMLLSIDSYAKLESLFDKYSRKCLIWIFLLFTVLFGTLFNIISLSINSKSFELLEAFNSNLLIIGAVLFFYLKNILIMVWLNKRIDFENEKIFKKSIRKVYVFSLIYFIVSLGIYYGFEKIFVFNLFAAIMVIYYIYAFIFYFIKSKKFTYNDGGFNQVLFIVILLTIIFGGGYLYLSRDIWLTQPYINQIPNIYEGNSKIEYNDQTGVYTITSDKDDFKILQLTDIHLGGGVISYDKDLKALQAVYKLIDYSKPDLVIVTGDLTYPLGLSSFSFNNTAPVLQFAAFMRNLGVPWAFTYGNHDTETSASGSKKTLNELYKSISYKTSKNLLYPYVQPTINGSTITGRNNQLIELRNSDGTLNQAIFLLDSNAYIGKGFSKYDNIHNDQVEWYKTEIFRLNKSEGEKISTLEFFHIPLKEYKEAYDLYMSGSKQVKYYFGFNKENVSFSEEPSSLFEIARVLKTSKGFFCGHDHSNNISLEYKGIRLTYGMSIDYLVEPGIARETSQRGGTLITTHKDSSISVVQIPLENIEYLYKK